MILVTGAAGTTGSEVVRQLAAKGVRVRALIRNPEKAKLFSGPGMETVVADLEKPATLDPALKGVVKVYLASSPDPRVGLLHGNLIDAAKRAGVRQIVRLSAVGAATGSPAQFLKWHGDVDERLSRSGLSYSILRPQFFMQNLFAMRAAIMGDGKLPLPAKDVKVSMIDARDVAASAAAVLGGEGHSGRIYELTGPESLSFAQVAEKLSAVLGRPVAYADIPPDAARTGLVAAGWPQWMADGFVEMLSVFAAAGPADVTNTVEKLTGKKPRALEVFVKDFAPVFEGKVGAEV
jgi:uncharacterized protein YbjT (DUF2867 family)